MIIRTLKEKDIKEFQLIEQQYLFKREKEYQKYLIKNGEYDEKLAKYRENHIIENLPTDITNDLKMFCSRCIVLVATFDSKIIGFIVGTKENTYVEVFSINDDPKVIECLKEEYIKELQTL